MLSPARSSFPPPETIDTTERFSADGSGDFAFLHGDGEMSERIRAFDWSQTAIGAPSGWSPALRTMLGIMLANRFPHVLWWGPKYIQFYNDPYRPIPGTKHPDKVLGRPANECWEEIWHVIGPLIDRPYYGGPATWDDDIFLELNRHGFLEETHFTIAYSPVPDETVPGGIGGVLATVHEITEKVVGERRVVALRDLGARVGEARTAEEACAVAASILEGHSKDIPFALLYLIDRDGREARLAGTAGIEPGQDISPAVVRLDGDEETAWPLAETRRSGMVQLVSNLGARFKTIPAGPWSDPPNSAVVVPVPSRKPNELAGFLVAGVSARLKFDQFYRDFFELVRSQIATAIANASAYEEEKRRAETLAELDRAKTVFFSNVSHEFRTPLTLMLAPIEDLLSGSRTELAPAIKDQLQLVNRNGVRLLRLVNTLLDFSRIEAGRIKATYEPTDIGPFTAELASVFRAATERAGLRLSVDCPGLPQPLYVDREMWEKIVLNLISNAFKFTFEGEIAVTVRKVSPSRSGEGDEGWVQLSVRDTGVGIPAEEMPRLFERFHRIEATRSRTHEGSGIGLALVQELVRLHGGTVAAESAVGTGTTFTVTIPLGEKHLPPERIGKMAGIDRASVGATAFVQEALRWLPEAEKEPDLLPTMDGTVVADRPRQKEASGERASILFADDNADMRLYVKRLLGAKYDVEIVPDGKAALASARKHAPDLILSDVMMPQLDGFGLLREVRSDASLRNTPVILLSARAGEESRVEGLGEGADDYLVKPFSARELTARIESHLQLGRLRREAELSMRRRSRQFETLVNQAPLGVYLVDADFRIAQVNPIAQETFGNIPHLIGRSFEEVIRLLWAREYADEHVRIFRRTLETGEPYQTPDRTEYRIDRQATEHYEWRVDRITLPEGRYGVVCYFRDISERKRHEANLSFLARLSVELAPLTTASGVMAMASEELFRELRASRVIFVEMNEEAGEITVLGGRSEYGLPHPQGKHSLSEYLSEKLANELRAGKAVAISDITADDRTAEQAAAIGAWAAQSLLLAPFVTEGHSRFLAVITKATPYEWRTDEVDLLREVAGQIYIRVERARAEEALGKARDDLHEHAAKLEQTVAERTEHLRSTVQELEAFSYSIAHDMRAPLRAMQGFAKLLQEEYGAQLADGGKTYLQKLYASANRLDALIQDVLNYSKIARAEMKLEAVDPKRLLQEILESYPNLQPPAAVIRVEGRIPAVLANRAALTQVMSNLLGNGVKFVAKGVLPELKVWAENVDRENVRIWFEDNGIGIRPDARERIFMMFQRLNAPAAYEGTGIGLTIVKKAMERMGGKVGVESQPGAGSRFWITLARASGE